MFFRDIIGQDSIKQRLIKEAREKRVPHALLFTGPEGVGKILEKRMLAENVLHVRCSTNCSTPTYILYTP